MQRRVRRNFRVCVTALLLVLCLLVRCLLDALIKPQCFYNLRAILYYTWYLIRSLELPSYHDKYSYTVVIVVVVVVEALLAVFVARISLGTLSMMKTILYYSITRDHSNQDPSCRHKHIYSGTYLYYSVRIFGPDYYVPP